MAELLVWPVMIAYGEAAFAYAQDLRGPGLAGRLAIWGVRLGWLIQTALLLSQALSSDGFPWGTWAGALNLFAWLIVGAYLFWGCSPRYRLLGVAVMPVAAALIVAAWAGGGTGVSSGGAAGGVLAVHAGLMLAGLAGLSVAACMAGFYLWQERRLKRRDAGVLRLRVPSLESLDRVAARVTAVSFAVLSVGIVVGLVSIERGEFDAAMTVALCIWVMCLGVLGLRREAGLQGRHFAWALVAVAGLVVVVLPITHFAS
jgi:ABC-type uncharacterized transport system permease subunit